MKLEPKLLLRIVPAFVFIILILVINNIFIVNQEKKLEKQIHELETSYQPSINNLISLNAYYEDVKNLMRYWIYTPFEYDSLFRTDFHHNFIHNINPLVNDLLLISAAWNEEDLKLMAETAHLIRDSLYVSLKDILREFNSAIYAGNTINELANQVEESEIIFLFSEIEQNLNYLIDKKNSEVSDILSLMQIHSLNSKRQAIYILVLIIIAVISSLLWYYAYITKAFTLIARNIESLSKGIIPSNIKSEKDDAFSIIYSRMNNLYAYLANLVELSNQILKKDFSGNIKPLGDKDQLGIALVNLQYSLKQATEDEEMRKKEDRERQWVSEGIAKINDILRISEDKIEELSYQLIKEIINYTGSCIGAIFIINNTNPDDVLLELSASYAYDRRKYLEKQIRPGEGLAGRCVKENETIHITEIPENYLTIQSGLGQNKPASILLIPLKLNDSVYGVIELATFLTYQPYQIKFLETLGENIATSVSKIKINIQTSSLLEQTRQQAEEMSTQEEEMRQNMEELRATQEQSAIREEKLIREIEELRKKTGL